MDMIQDPTEAGLDPFYYPYPFPKPPITARQLANQFGARDSHGEFLLREFMKAIANKEPADRFGYPYLMSDAAKDGWRRYQVDRLANALDTVKESFEMLYAEPRSIHDKFNP